MRLAIIPARGGSKRIPRKNIRTFAGKPIIAWSIEAAQNSGCFDKILVSTDDQEIADVARAHNCDVPFTRPAELSDDQTGTTPVVAHGVEWALKNNMPATEICCIYATAPFIEAADLRLCLDRLIEEGCDYVFPVAQYAFPIQRAVKITSSGRAAMFDPTQFATRSQDLEEAYHDAGQFYWGRRDAWLSRRPIFSADSVPAVIPRYRVQDIDTEEDWRYAELMFEVLARLVDRS